MTMGLSEMFPDFDYFREADFLPASCRKPTIMLAMTPRTGSTHLCAALAAASAGRCALDEVFNPRGVVQNLKQRRQVDSFADYIEAFARQPGPFFMFKTTWHDFRVVAPFSRRMFPELRVIYLDRLNTVAQAVSMFRAMKTELWHKHPDGRMGGQVAKNGLMPAHEIRLAFDAVQIGKIRDDLEQERWGWVKFFAAERIEPLRITYEEFCDDVQVALHRIGARFGLVLDQPVGPEVGCVRLADEINDEWIARVSGGL